MGAPVSSQLIELTLNDHPQTRRAHALLALADQLLYLIGQHLPETAPKRAAVLRQRIDAWRSSLHKETDPIELVALARQIAQDCETLLNRIRAEAADREAEFADLVQTLRSVVEAIRGDSFKFDTEMHRSATAMERIVETQDIRELKRALVREIHNLRTTIAERQRAELQTAERLAAQVKSLEENLQKARAEAAKDAVTGIPNRGAFNVALQDWLARAAREGRPFTLGLIDLDDFKAINDAHGHPVGDRVLVAATQLLTEAVDYGEVVCRYGGEEFAVLLNTPTVAAAKARLTSVLQRIAPAYEYESDSERRFVTFSFSGGVTEYAAGDSPEAIIKRADEALYEAKRRGKKRIETKTRGFLRTLVG